MEATTENIATVIEAMEKLDWFEGFPETDEQQELNAVAWLQVLNSPQELDLLINEIAQRCEKFPTPIVVRWIYSAMLVASIERRENRTNATLLADWIDKNHNGVFPSSERELRRIYEVEMSLTPADGTHWEDVPERDWVEKW